MRIEVNLMNNPETIEIHGLKTINKLCKFGADNNMEGCSFTEIVDRMFAELTKLQSVPEGFVLAPKEKIASLVDELHVAFKSNLHLTTGELLPLQQDFQLMIEAQ